MRPPPPIPDVLLLDAGNTLVFLDHEVFAAVLREQGERVTADDVRAAEMPALRQYAEWMRRGVGHDEGWAMYVAEIVRRAGVPPGRARRRVEPLRAEHERFNLWRRVGEGVPAALDRLRHAGVRLGVVSNSEGRLVELLDRLDLAWRFEVIVDSGLEGVSKPSPELFHRALRRLDEPPPRRAVYAGDVPEVDVAGARAAELDAVLVDALDRYRDYDDAPRVRDLPELAAAWLGSPQGS